MESQLSLDKPLTQHKQILLFLFSIPSIFFNYNQTLNLNIWTDNECNTYIKVLKFMCEFYIQGLKDYSLHLTKQGPSLQTFSSNWQIFILPLWRNWLKTTSLIQLLTTWLNKTKSRKKIITLIYHHYWKGFFLVMNFCHLAPTKKRGCNMSNDSFGKKHKVAIYQGNKLELAIFRSWYIVGFEKNSTFLSDL